jgi:hypothetical protein
MSGLSARTSSWGGEGARFFLGGEDSTKLRMVPFFFEPDFLVGLAWVVGCAISWSDDGGEESAEDSLSDMMGSTVVCAWSWESRRARAGGEVEWTTLTAGASTIQRQRTASSLIRLYSNCKRRPASSAGNEIH